MTMSLLATVALVVCTAFGNVQPSPLRGPFHFNVTDPDSRLGVYGRKYRAHTPPQCEKGGCPLLMWFHGWCGDPTCTGCKWGGVADAQSFVIVMPVGMADGPKGTCPGWNIVGDSQDRDLTCVHADTLQTGMNFTYDSCAAVDKVGPCNTYTCYDDVHAVEEMVFDVVRRWSIDLSRVYAGGASNGALFSHHLAGRLVERKASFRLQGIAPWYGGFYQGMINVPTVLKGIRIAHFHGLLDTTIPVLGGETTEDGHMYAPLNQTLARYASVNHCDGNLPVSISTPFDGMSINFRGCWAYPNCSGRLVARCNFHAPHGFWEDYSAAMTWWFLTEYGRSPGSETFMV